MQQFLYIQVYSTGDASDPVAFRHLLLTVREEDIVPFTSQDDPWRHAAYQIGSRSTLWDDAIARTHCICNDYVIRVARDHVLDVEGAHVG